MQLHHAGIATRDAGTLAELFADLLGADVVHEESVDGVDAVFVAVGEGYLEVLEPVDDGPVDRFLDREGPGIHHLAFATDDAAAALERARELGIEPVDETPRPGAWGHDVAFLHPADTGGALIEFVEE